MRLSEITLRNFRSHESIRVKFDQNLTLIVGKNGTGKTNLLEAIYVLCYGTSFRVNDTDLIRYDAADWQVKGLFENHGREVRYELGKNPAKQWEQWGEVSPTAAETTSISTRRLIRYVSHAHVAVVRSKATSARWVKSSSKHTNSYQVKYRRHLWITRNYSRDET